MATQTIEQYLFTRLNEIAPGKYVLAPFLQRTKATQRFACDHLKGGRHLRTGQKDYNLSVFTYITGITEVKCLYGCGLKITSADNKSDYEEVLALARLGTNHPASSETLRQVSNKRGILPIDPGPVPTYTDADRARVQERERLFWEWAKANPEEYKKQYGNISPNHPDPIEAPESIIERKMSAIMASRPKPLPRTKLTQDTFEALRASHIAAKSAPKVVFQDEGVPALEPVKKIRKTRKTQSRKSRKK